MNLVVGSSIANITHLASRKSCLVIIIPNLNDKFTKRKNKSLESFLALMNITHLPLKSYLPIIRTNSNDIDKK